MSVHKSIMNKEVAAQKVQRLALQVAENLSGDDAPLIVAGIKNSGMAIAEKIVFFVQEYIDVPVKIISVSFDKHAPDEIELSEPIDFNGKNILLIDDVCNSGKTLLYALKPMLGFYPKRIQTLVLIERMHKLFPVKPDYVGLSLATTLQDFIHVEVVNGEINGAYVESLAE